jgi:tRNA(Arg) A34 adenosine deaminase TadA
VQAGTAGLMATSLASPGEALKKTIVLPAAFKKLDHERYMRLAIEQAKKVPDCPFGSVIVNAATGKVVSEGWVRMDKTPVWHGEMTAILNCPDSTDDFKWQEMCLYTTGESCPMCQSAIVWTKMPLAVYGSSIPFLQTCRFGQINIRAQRIVDAALFDYGDCTIIGGVLEKECNALFETAKKMNAAPEV